MEGGDRRVSAQRRKEALYKKRKKKKKKKSRKEVWWWGGKEHRGGVDGGRAREGQRSAPQEGGGKRAVSVESSRGHTPTRTWCEGCGAAYEAAKVLDGAAKRRGSRRQGEAGGGAGHAGAAWWGGLQNVHPRDVVCSATGPPHLPPFHPCTCQHGARCGGAAKPISTACESAASAFPRGDAGGSSPHPPRPPRRAPPPAPQPTAHSPPPLPPSRLVPARPVRGSLVVRLPARPLKAEV